MRRTKEFDLPSITAKTFNKLCKLLEVRYPGKVWRVLEVCPVAVIKTIDNEDDALETIRNLEKADGAKCSS